MSPEQTAKERKLPADSQSQKLKKRLYEDIRGLGSLGIDDAILISIYNLAVSYADACVLVARMSHHLSALKEKP